MSLKALIRNRVKGIGCGVQNIGIKRGHLWNQFSVFNPGTWGKCLVLALTTVKSLDRAIEVNYGVKSLFWNYGVKSLFLTLQRM
jgi:hypothetical protein